MRISKQAIELMNTFITEKPPEIGGILGSSNEELIDNIIFDTFPTVTASPCIYTPNVDYLNERIVKWQDNGISFMGIFHTHFVGAKTLSCGDRKYINAIMGAMPQCITSLYFPVFVLPDRELVCYKAIRRNGIIDIQTEDLIIE